MIRIRKITNRRERQVTVKKFDWLGLCLEMMSEYFPTEVRSKSDAEKYWNISEHLMRLLEFIESDNRHNRDEKSNERNAVVKDMVRIFTMINTNLLETAKQDTETDINFDNAALNNLLLLSIIS